MQVPGPLMPRFESFGGCQRKAPSLRATLLASPAFGLMERTLQESQDSLT